MTPERPEPADRPTEGHPQPAADEDDLVTDEGVNEGAAEMIEESPAAADEDEP